MTRHILVILVTALFISSSIQAQEGALAPLTTPERPASHQQQSKESVQSTTQPSSSASILQDNTPIRLKLNQTISSSNAKAGQTVDFEVLEEVQVGETIVIPKGGIAWATITEAQSKRSMGRGGKLNVNIDAVRLADGEKVPLRAVQEAKGGGHTAAMTTGIVASAIVFFPAAPLFLFVHGKDITIPKGTEITAYVAGDTPLNLAKFRRAAAGDSTVASTAVVDHATLDFASVPAGADIELDGSFAGNTPSTVSVASGDHAIRICKTGFKCWERKLKTGSGVVTLIANLEVQAEPEAGKTADSSATQPQK